MACSRVNFTFTFTLYWEGSEIDGCQETEEGSGRQICTGFRFDGGTGYTAGTVGQWRRRRIRLDMTYSRTNVFPNCIQKDLIQSSVRMWFAVSVLLCFLKQKCLIISRADHDRLLPVPFQSSLISSTVMPCCFHSDPPGVGTQSTAKPHFFAVLGRDLFVSLGRLSVHNQESFTTSLSSFMLCL